MLNVALLSPYPHISKQYLPKRVFCSGCVVCVHVGLPYVRAQELKTENESAFKGVSFNMCVYWFVILCLFHSIPASGVKGHKRDLSNKAGSFFSRSSCNQRARTRHSDNLP